LTTFAVVKAGTVTVTIGSLTPALTGTVALGLGTLSVAGTCSFSITNLAAAASTTPQITTSSEAPGQYCLEIYDLGTLTTPETFTITIQHT
jgi:hypothetical protein